MPKSKRTSARLLVMSHRGPSLSDVLPEDGSIGQSTAGGLVPIVASVLATDGGSWVYAAASEDDHRLATESPGGQMFGDVTFRPLAIPTQTHRLHYNVISTNYLAALFHYLFNVAYEPAFDSTFRDAWDAYCSVNDLFGQAAVQTRDETDAVLVEDSHLMLVGSTIRSRLGVQSPPTHYFHHIPWCEPDYLSILPEYVRTRLLVGMLQYDTVGFHCSRWANAFLRCCECFLKGSVVDNDCVDFNERRVRVVSAPAPVNQDQLKKERLSSSTSRWTSDLRLLTNDRWILARVDRADLWKNVLRGFYSWERFLEREPSEAQDTMLLAVLRATRTWLPRNEQYLKDCLAIAERINARFGRVNRPVIHVLVEDDAAALDRGRCIAAMERADAMLINPTFDGLNLVAKEAISVSDPALVLSRNAGVFEELGAYSIPVDPFDVEQTSEAISQARRFSQAERQVRAKRMRQISSRNTPAGWIARRLGSTGG